MLLLHFERISITYQIALALICVSPAISLAGLNSWRQAYLFTLLFLIFATVPHNGLLWVPNKGLWDYVEVNFMLK